MTQLLALAMLFALLRYLRKPARVQDLPPTYTVTPWDEFRSRVCEATGRSTVAGNPEVTQYPGGWIVWENLAHQVTDAAMPLEEALKRGPCSESEHEAPQVAEPLGSLKPGIWHVDTTAINRGWAGPEAVNRIGYRRPTKVLCEFTPEVTLTTGDPAPAELASALANSSPWIGRRVWAYGRDFGKVGYHVGDSLFCAIGTPDAADAELHWDDVRAGDVQTADAFWADPVDRKVIDRTNHILHVASTSGRDLCIVPTGGDRFLPASA